MEVQRLAPERCCACRSCSVPVGGPQPERGSSCAKGCAMASVLPTSEAAANRTAIIVFMLLLLLFGSREPRIGPMGRCVISIDNIGAAPRASQSDARLEVPNSGIRRLSPVPGRPGQE